MDIEKVKADLREKIRRANIVVKELPVSGAFQILLEDFASQKKLIDDNWHLVADETKLKEFRITKFAVMTLLNTVQNYENDLRMATQELNKLENPDTVIGKDYDSQ